MARPAQDLVAHVERVQDIEREQRDVRGLQHVAAGIEHDLRRLGSFFVRLAARVLAEPRQLRVGELHARELHHVARDQAETVDTELALLIRLVLRARHGRRAPWSAGSAD